MAHAAATAGALPSDPSVTTGGTAGTGGAAPTLRAGEAGDAGGVVARLGSLIPSLRESERKVAEFVQANAGDVVYLSITELADRTGTSEATVIRFARQLGYPGYAAFKIALALDLRRHAAASPAGLTPQSDVAAVKASLIEQSIENLHHTAQLLDPLRLEQAVAALVEARRIEIYGVGGSAAVAQDAGFALMRVGLPAVVVTDPHLQVMSAVQLRSGDVALAVSQSGGTRDTVEALQLARDAGATCLCITRHARSPITRVAHVTLLAAAHAAPIAGIPALSRVSQVAVVDILAWAAALRRQDASLAALARGRQAISQSKKF